MDKVTRERLMSSGKTDYGTPKDKFGFLHYHFRFDVDVCAVSYNAKLDNFFSPEDDGLSQDWGGSVCYMNPPYGDAEQPCKDPQKCKKKKCAKRGWHATEYIPGIKDWVKKAVSESKKDKTTVVCLVPTRSDTVWYQHLWNEAELLCQVRGRWQFEGASDPALFPLTVAVLGERPAEHIFEALREFGNVIDVKKGVLQYNPSNGRK